MSTVALETWDLAMRWVVHGYARSPELMMGLAAVLVLPPLAVIGALLLHGRARPMHVPAAFADDDGYVPDWRQQVAVEIEGSDRPPAAIQKGLTRIGRQDDNEICIPDASVHRYHAAIERSPETGVLICDLSGPDGNGVRLNGERVETALLKHGDVVELGRARLRLAWTTQADPMDDYAGTGHASRG